jgi:hypothetical protein
VKIGVISDTHIPVWTKNIPPIVLSSFKEVNLILHAGDLLEMEVLGELCSLARVEAVQGNMDAEDVRRTLPLKQTIEVMGIRIGLIHGKGSPRDLVKYVSSQFEGVQCIVFGHSHIIYNKFHGGCLFFNPGSPTDPVFASYKSFGILTIDEDKKIRGEIIKI